MPRIHQEGIRGREVLPQSADRVALQVTARPVDTTSTHAPHAELDGLLEGLKTLNPKLEQYIGQQNAEKNDQGRQLAATQANSIANPRDVVNAPVAIPEAVTPALHQSFMDAYNKAIGTNLGHQIKTHIIGEYEKQKNTEGFDRESFLQSMADKELEGIKEPTIRAHAAESIQKAAYTIREEARRSDLQQLQESGKISLNKTLETVVAPGMEPKQIAEQLHTVWIPTAKAMGLFTRPEMSKMVVDKLSVLSDRMGGRPELFEVAYIKDPAGIAIADHPELAQKVEDLREKAIRKRDNTLNERDALENAQARILMERNPEAVTDADIWANFHPKHGIFKTDDEVWAFMKRRDTVKQAKALTAQNIELIRTGQAWRIDEKEDAEEAFNALTSPYVDELVKAVTSGDGQAIHQASIRMHQIIGIHAQSGRDLANKQLKGLFNGLATEVPQPGQPPSSKFSAAVEMYRAMPPNLRELYMEGDTKQLMSNYLYEIESKVEPITALSKAFMSISPEAKKLAAERLKSPEVQTRIAKYVAGEATSFYRNLAAKLIPFDESLGIYPDNESVVGAAAQIEARRFLEKNPNASDGQLKGHLQQYVAARYTYEETSNKLVEIPPGVDPQTAAEAFKLYTERIAKELSATSNWLTYKNADIQMIYKGNGVYQTLSLRDQASYGEVTIGKLMKELANSKVLVQESGEDAKFAELRSKIIKKTATSADLKENEKLITKAKAVGAWRPELEFGTEQLRTQERWGKRSALFRNVPEAYNDELTKAPPRGKPQAMGTVAKKFLDQGNFTAALITLGEGVVQKATPDPASGAGNNIGMGYNLNANAGNIAEDFRKAGIPSEMIEGVKAGKIELTEDQAMRLLLVTIPRYESMAEKGLEKLHPGEWAKLPPNHKAALTDLAYQVGSVDKFPKALAALIAGNTTEAGDKMTVSYKKSGTGERVIDTRRNNLRYQMLTKPNGFAGLSDYHTRKASKEE
jgi:GH24 family phage-related lysozyme (muramidase)